MCLADACFQRGIHLTNFATGCLYEYDDEHPIGGKPFTEDDPPNFKGSFYSKTKGLVEILLKEYPNVLTLRMRMPVDEEPHPRNFIMKITTYAKVINIPNSMTVLNELLPVAIDMSRRKLTGMYNFTNPGAISHNEILEMYQKYIDPKFVWTNFSIEEQDKILKAKRSNNELDVTKLLKEYPNIKPVKAAVEDAIKKMKSKL